MQGLRRHLVLLFAAVALAGSLACPAHSAPDSSGKLRIYSRTDKNGDVTKKKDTVVLWSDAVVESHEELDSVVVAWGKVHFHGRAKDLVVVGGEVILHDDARVDGSLVVLGGKLHKSEGAKVTEQVLFELPGHMPKWIAFLGPVFSFAYSEGAALLYVVVRAVFVCLFGALLYVIAPDLMREAETMAERKPLKSLFWTLMGAFLFIPGIVVLAISIVGIFFIPLFIMFYAFVYFFCAFVMAANILGHHLPPRESVVMPPLRFFYGVFIFVLISYIPVVGSLVIYLAMAFTGGAMFYTFFHRLRGRMRA